jgi:hypothetical protein
MRVGTFLGLAAFAFCFWLYSQCVVTAPVSYVQEVVAMAEKSPAAKAFVADALSKDPVPNYYRVAEIKSDVNMILVRDVTASAGGVQLQGPATAKAPMAETVVAKSSVKEEALARSQQESFEQVLAWAALFVTGCILIKATFMFRHLQSGRY